MKKPDIRLLLTDLDGSLLHNDHLTVSERTRKVLQALKDHGVKLCACTGRPLCVLPPAIEEIGFDYAITCNGASCIDRRAGFPCLADGRAGARRLGVCAAGGCAGGLVHA